MFRYDTIKNMMSKKRYNETGDVPRDTQSILMTHVTNYSFAQAPTPGKGGLGPRIPPRPAGVR